jgi:hypothetical protein
VSRERARRRRRLLFRLTLSLVCAGVFAAIGYSSYRTGSALAEREVLTQRVEIERLQTQADADKEAIERLRADLRRSQEATVALQQRYTADVPSGGLATLVTLLRQTRGAGVEDDRIAQILREVGAARPCGDRVVRRRLPIATKTPGPDDVVTFLDGLVQVSASMPSGSDGSAKVPLVTISRAWAAEPIKMEGLPVQGTISIYNTDLKLAVVASDLRGYVEASLSTCGKG